MAPDTTQSATNAIESKTVNMCISIFKMKGNNWWKQTTMNGPGK